MVPPTWLSSADFAVLAGISRQAARKVLGSAARGKGWRGQSLLVKICAGRGGHGGFSYQVALESLPPTVSLVPSLQSLDQTPLVRPLSSPNSTSVVSARWKIVEPALLTPRQSRARAAAIAAAADTSGRCPRTLYRWIARYESKGIGALARTKTPNASNRRITVSRRFDTAFRLAGYTDRQLLSIGCDVERSLKGLWASRAEGAGAAEIRRLAEFLLVEICEANRVALPETAFQLSRRVVDRFSNYRIVNIRKNDRKTFDNGRPRIRRNWTALAPMERVVADVKHLDVIVRREDGSQAWPKIVAFMDAGTSRVFVHAILLGPGEGVRREHVAEAFLAMVAHPAWGFPKGLYLDNGQEFSGLAKIDAALKQLNHPGARTIIFAGPYNAAANPIEGLFARLDRYVFAMMPGYAGPDRLSKKTQTVGRPPDPYEGDWTEFSSTLQLLVAAHNHRPVGGQWGGRSPQEWLEQKVEEGWRRSTVDISSLDAAFADLDSRRVDRGVVKVRGQRFSHPLLVALPTRSIVDLALPWRESARPMAYLAGAWVYLDPEVIYPARWIEGARRSEIGRQRQDAHVTALQRDAPHIDPISVKLRWAARLPQAAEIPVGDEVDLGSATHRRGMDMKKADAKAASVNLSRAQAKTRNMKITEHLERMQLDGK